MSDYGNAVKTMVKMAAATAKEQDQEVVATTHYFDPYLETIIATPSGRIYVKRECLRKSY
jgi:tyrosine-protein phosphatase YwqE